MRINNIRTLSFLAAIVAAVTPTAYAPSLASAHIALSPGVVDPCKPEGGNAAEPFDNGGFESPIVKKGARWDDYRAGDSVGPWKVGGGGIGVAPKSYWPPAEGNQSIDLNGPGVAAGSITQTFATVPCHSYKVTFAVAGHPNDPPRIKTGEALIDGVVFKEISFDTSNSSWNRLGFVYEEFTFQATKSATTITFASTVARSDHGIVLDDVRIRECDCGGAVITPYVDGPAARKAKTAEPCPSVN
ncbi:DUF642 domain-containing protein [Streptomyces sp. NPDC090112]|uniref:DUF642 domain-containing protein n=1 Tax=Streptomyces sp. NPDC090112 TaxID=3365949 RepID=UPI00382B29EE